MKISPEKPTKITQGLDYYKATMSHVAHEYHQSVPVTFELINRRNAQPLHEYIDIPDLQARLDTYRAGWHHDEIAFLASQTRKNSTEPLFNDDYLTYLSTHELPEIHVSLSPETGDIAVSTSGEWPMVTFWETVVMSEVNEMYFESYAQKNGLDLGALYDEGDRRLSEKIALLRTRPDIKFADFGTRRRFSYRWQKHVVSRLADECPDNFIGTSNIWLARELGLMPIGTYAHEMPMVYSALWDQRGFNPLFGHRHMLTDWTDTYGDNLSTALTDTFTSDYFFADLTPNEATEWQALRHDSGDPFTFVDKVIDFYARHEINPLTKTIVFSDGLDIDTIIHLADYCKDRIACVFGWGTTLTNDLGLIPLNIVMKAVEANGQSTVKLSDNLTKILGEQDVVDRYQQAVARIVGSRALATA